MRWFDGITDSMDMNLSKFTDVWLTSLSMMSFKSIYVVEKGRTSFSLSLKAE